MWHSSRLTSSLHRAHLLPSRSQTVRRVLAQISAGCRRIPIPALPHRKLRDYETTETNATAIAQAHELAGIPHHPFHFVLAHQRVLPNGPAVRKINLIAPEEERGEEASNEEGVGEEEEE